jgi:hypothetical protein
VVYRAVTCRIDRELVKNGRVSKEGKERWRGTPGRCACGCGTHFAELSKKEQARLRAEWAAEEAKYAGETPLARAARTHEYYQPILHIRPR